MVKKFNGYEMNEHRRAVYKQAIQVLSDYIGGYENTLDTADIDSSEYEYALNFLRKDHNELVIILFNDIKNEIERSPNSRHLRFAGDDFLKEVINTRLRVWGY